jgi:putative N6-adenine-specific DNA methylase
MFRVNLRSRSVTRVLLRLKRFTALSLNDIRQRVLQVDWGKFLDSECAIHIQASCHASRLMHTGKIEHEIAEAIKHSGFAHNSGKQPRKIYIRIVNNRCLLSIDTSGERLDRRGYRHESGKAPVRETLAAAVLQWMEWKADEPLMVPMCGSGTFAIEAAMAGIRQAPGLTHEFPFLTWPQLKQKGWERVLKRTQTMIRRDITSLPVYASDINPDAIRITRRNAQRAGVEELIRIEQHDVKELSGPADGGPGVMVCNPPYGQRINTNVHALYAALGSLYRKSYDGWRMAVFSPDAACEQALGLNVKRRLKIKHGGKWINILHI